jgi:uncharacterized protein YkwD
MSAQQRRACQDPPMLVRAVLLAAFALSGCVAATDPAASGPRGERPDGASNLRGDEPPAEGTPAASADFLSPIERQVALALDDLRRDPPGYAAALSAHRARFDGDEVTVPGEAVPIRTVEGTAAVDEAIAVVRRTSPIAPMVVSSALSRIARSHAERIGAAGTLDHDSPDGAPHERMGAAGRLGGQSGENIGTGYADGGMMLLSLVVDDGVGGRGHRKNLLEPAFRVVGIGCAAHRAYRWVCVLDLAESFAER